MSLQEGFEHSLQIFDPLLSVRRGIALEKWVIERKAFIGEWEKGFLTRRRERAFRSAHREQDAKKRDYKTDLAKQIAEESYSAQRDKRVILFSETLDRRIFDMLAASDIRGYGGYSRFADALDAQEDAKERDQARMESNKNQARNAETYDVLNFLWRKRETDLLAGKRNIKELLR